MHDAREHPDRQPRARRATRRSGGEGVPDRVRLVPHGNGWRASAPHFLVWQESERETAEWARVLAPRAG